MRRVGGGGGFFFFQAEDGIRDIGVTGVQTCALPICSGTGRSDIACPFVILVEKDNFGTQECCFQHHS